MNGITTTHQNQPRAPSSAPHRQQLRQPQESAEPGIFYSVASSGALIIWGPTAIVVCMQLFCKFCGKMKNIYDVFSRHKRLQNHIFLPTNSQQPDKTTEDSTEPKRRLTNTNLSQTNVRELWLLNAQLSLQRPYPCCIFLHLWIIFLYLGYLVGFPCFLQRSPCLAFSEFLTAHQAIWAKVGYKSCLFVFSINR